MLFASWDTQQPEVLDNYTHFTPLLQGASSCKSLSLDAVQLQMILTISCFEG